MKIINLERSWRAHIPVTLVSVEAGKASGPIGY